MKISEGSPVNLGARIENLLGVNFALYSRNASKVKLLLFQNRDDNEPAKEIELSPIFNRTGDVWHIFIEGLGKGQLYGYRVYGSQAVKEGHRFNPQKILLDPYAKAVADLQGVPKSLVVEGSFDWEGIPKPRIPLQDTIIYETHVRGLTAHPSSKAQYPGTYRGVIEKIPYFKQLGITAVEFLPLQEFNHHENPRLNPLTGEKLGNYWGYSTVAFFAPKASYCSRGDCGEQVDEFKLMVRELHRAGIEVILDIVFNHTAEMNQKGSVYSFKGIDNRAYYLLEKDQRRYRNLTGCGNTFFCNHPAGVNLIVDCLKYWVTEMGVDGFRFDLATIFNRNQRGQWWEYPPILLWINNDPVLRDTKLIAEAWDAAGGYKVGSFGGARWCDWNDRFRDDSRRFWRGDAGTIGNFASRLAGSADLFYSKGTPLSSVNYITCHDGFTLHDLVSYKRKRNTANGHGNRDGQRENHSMNCGIEGETDQTEIVAKRITMVKNFIATLFLSQGIPMISGGDEFMRTQKGNNNPYCQDTEISWYDWSFLERYEEITRFYREMIRFRRQHPALRRNRFFLGKDNNSNSIHDISWFSCDGKRQSWVKEEKTLACLIDGAKEETGASSDDNDIYIMFNADWRRHTFKIHPEWAERKWYLVLNTANIHPQDIFPPGQEPPAAKEGKITLEPHSTVVLISRMGS